MASQRLNMPRRTFPVFKRIRFYLWLIAYRIYTFPGNAVYYLYAITFLKYFCGDMCWFFRRMRQEKEVEEKRKEFLSA